LAALAEAPTAEVIRVWAGLGYNLRAVRLQEIARQALAEHDGQIPATLRELLALKGIGRYTAGAVACFAFHLPVATVDTNMRRVLWRVFRGIEPATWASGERATRDTLALAEWALPPERTYDWQQALMDLGATVCMGRRPLCERCPLATCCAAFAETATLALFSSGEALVRIRDERAYGLPVNKAADRLRVAERQATYVTDVTDVTDVKEPPLHGRQSARRRLQEPFKRSSRYFRGRIVAS